MSLGKTLTELRKKAGLTQGELGAKLNISAQAISKWENDISEPDITTLKKLSTLYNVPLVSFLGSENETYEGDIAIPKSEDESGAISSNLFDVLITGLPSGPKKRRVFLGLQHMYNINQPYVIMSFVRQGFYPLTGMVDREEAECVQRLLTEAGASVVIKAASGKYEKRELKAKDIPEINTTPKMVIRFIGAHVYSIAAALVLYFVLSFFGSIFEAKLGFKIFSIIISVLCFSVVFLIQYPTITRYMLSADFFEKIPDSINEMPVVLFLLVVLMVIIYLPMAVIVAALSPIDYILSLKKRIRRIIDGDERDNIFGVYFDDRAIK